MSSTYLERQQAKTFVEKHGTGVAVSMMQKHVDGMRRRHCGRDMTFMTGWLNILGEVKRLCK